MIRQEIAMEKLRSNMAATQRQVTDALGKLAETTGNERTILKRVSDELKEEVNKNIRNYVAEMEKLKGKTTIIIIYLELAFFVSCWKKILINCI
jgi:hypothetical protein